MAKGYWFTQVDITDAARYQAFVQANGAAFSKYGARFLARGATPEVVEGAGRSRCAIIEFPSYAEALACYRSPEYQRAKALRADACIADVLVLEGYDGP
jgi:uncharacterized protein (DUF1330 family)